MCILCDIISAKNQLHPSDERVQTVAEECANVLTHLFGLVYAIIQLITFRRYCKRRGFSNLKQWGVLAFCVTSLIMYANSTVYHLSNIIIPDWICLRYFFQRLDHVSIYILISGCYTCFIICRTFDKGWNKTGWLAIFVVVAMALIGFLFTIFAPPTTRADVIMYLAMGWSCLLYVPGVIYFCPVSLMVYLFTGGVSYAAGTFFLSYDRIYFNHGLWHLIVWAANFQHALGVLIACDDEQVKGLKQPYVLMKKLFTEFIYGEQKHIKNNTEE